MESLIKKYRSYQIEYNFKEKIIYIGKKIPVKELYSLKIDLLIYQIDYKDIIVGVWYYEWMHDYNASLARSFKFK